MFAEKYKNNQQEITTEITDIIKNIITKNQYNTERKEKEAMMRPKVTIEIYINLKKCL